MLQKFIQKLVVNFENTSIFETRVLNGPSVSSKVTDYGKNWKPILSIDDHQQQPWWYLAPFQRQCRFLL